jgi:OOP family OmpA-OmpF porin
MPDKENEAMMVGVVRSSLLLVTGVAVLTGCATEIPRSTCALIGGALGTVGGVVVANNETEDETDENLAAGGIGAVSGATLGYLLCAEKVQRPPRVSANASPGQGEPPLRVQLGAQATDEDGRVVSYVWDFGDGGRGEGATTSHTYERAGRYPVRVTVTDDDGLTASATTNVDIAAPVEAAPPSERRIVLQGISFAFDSAEISATDAPVLDVAAEQLQANPNVRVNVIGHTDSVGADEYNQKLSEKRAESVVEYLSRNGVAASRLEASGAGEGQPVASNDTSDGRAQNRRVELQIQE